MSRSCERCGEVFKGEEWKKLCLFCWQVDRELERAVLPKVSKEMGEMIVGIEMRKARGKAVYRGLRAKSPLARDATPPSRSS